MILEELVHSVFQQISEAKDDVLTRIANGTGISSGSATDTGMRYENQRGYLAGLQRADEIIRTTIKQLSTPKQVEGNSDVGSEQPAAETSRPHY